MKTETLWAPDRLGYLRNLKRTRKAGKSLACFLCEARKSRRDRETFVVERRRHAFCILNKYPYNIGHLMIVPNRHTADYGSLPTAALDEMTRMTRDYLKALGKFLDPDGYNLGTNLGAAGGAGLETHLHQHLVPRWKADTNFVTVLGGARVISMSLADLWAGLRSARGLAR